MNEAPSFQHDWTRDPEYMTAEQAKSKGFRWNAASERWQRLAVAKDEPTWQGRQTQTSQAIAPHSAPEVKVNPNEDVLTFGKREEFYVRGGSAGEILNQLFSGIASLQQAEPNPNADSYGAFDHPTPPAPQANPYPYADTEHVAAPNPNVDDMMDGEFIPGVVVEEPDEELDEFDEIQNEQTERDATKQERKKLRKHRIAKKLAIYALGAQIGFGGVVYASGSDDYILTPDNVQKSVELVVDVGTNVANIGKTIGGIFG